MVTLRYRGPPNINDYIKARYGIRPKDDPLSVFVEKVAGPLKDVLSIDTPVRVAQRWAGVNGLATKKFALISPNALNCLSVDGIAALIGHELSHISRGHVFSRPENDQTLKSYIGQVGKMRMQEYEADLRPMVMLAEAGYNPRGIYELQKHIAGEEVEQDLRAGLVHGSAVFRMLATQYIFRNRMVRNLSSSVKDVPIELRAAYPADHFSILVEKRKSNGAFAYDEDARIEAARQCHPIVAIEVLASEPNGTVAQILLDNGAGLFGGIDEKDARLLAALYSKLFAPEPSRELPDSIRAAARKDLGRISSLIGCIPEDMPVQNDGLILFRSIMTEINKPSNPSFGTKDIEKAVGLAEELSKACKSHLKNDQAVRGLISSAVVASSKREGKSLKEALDLIPLMPSNTGTLEFWIEKHYGVKKIKLKKELPCRKETEKKAEAQEQLEEAEMEFVRELRYLEKIRGTNEYGSAEVKGRLSTALISFLKTYNIRSFEKFGEHLVRMEKATGERLLYLLWDIIADHSASVFVSFFSKSYSNAWELSKAAYELDSQLGLEIQNHVLGSRKVSWKEWDDFVSVVGYDHFGATALEAFFNGVPEAKKDREEYFDRLKKVINTQNEHLGPGSIPDNHFDGFVYRNLKAKWDLRNPDHLDQLLTLSRFISSRATRLRLVTGVLDHLLPQLDPKEAMDIVFADVRCLDLPLDALERYVENHVSKPEDLEYILGKLEKKIRGIGPKDVGSIALIERAIERFDLDPFEVLTYMVTDKSDEKLWGFLVELDGNRKEAYQGYTALLDTPTAGRYFILTLLLMGTFKSKKGILLSEESRKKLWNWYLDRYVKQDNPAVYRMVKQKGAAFVAKADADDLFFAMLPLLYERFLVPSQKSVALKDVESNHPDFVPLPEKVREVMKWPAKKRSMKLTEVDVLCKVASKMGAPGVRFLQSLGMVVELPADMKDSFEQTYDSMKGQIKPTAYDTIRQEGNGLEKRTTLGRPIGGGSLMTVYEGTLDEKRAAIHVANPNALFFTDTTLRSMDVFLDDPDFQVARPLLDNIRAWVERDIGFHIDEHLAFAQNQSQWIYDGINARVPKLYYHSPNVVIDEFIEGYNLTKMEDVQKMIDPRLLAKALVNNIFYQMQTGYLHPDIHPGNIRIAEDGQLVWLDSLFILNLEQADRAFVSAIASGSIGNAAEYLGAQESFDSGPLKRINEGKGSWSDKLVKASIELRMQGVTIPLKPMLMLKNFLSLDSIVKRLGFGRIEDAF